MLLTYCQSLLLALATYAAYVRFKQNIMESYERGTDRMEYGPQVKNDMPAASDVEALRS